MTLPTALVAAVRDRLVADGSTADPGAVAAALAAVAPALTGASAVAAVASLRAELDGLGPLEALVSDKDVTDVLVNGPRDVWVDRGQGLQPSGIHFPDADSVRHLAVRLAAQAGRRLDEGQPYVDARLPDRSRLHAVLPPVAPFGPLISLRIPRGRPFTIDELVSIGTLDDEAAELVTAVVAARVAFVVSGGTGTGKTTLLSTLLGLVPHDERLVIVEDDGELTPDHPHVVRLEARRANVDGVGEITTRDLVRQALRMRPDRVVVGEVRGAEVVDLLAALNTGHEGGAGTLHANTADVVPARLEALGLAAGLPRDALHALLIAALDVVIHVHRGVDGVRRVATIDLVTTGPHGEATLMPAALFDSGRRHASTRHGPGYARLRARLGLRPIPVGA